MGSFIVDRYLKENGFQRQRGSYSYTKTLGIDFPLDHPVTATVTTGEGKIIYTAFGREPYGIVFRGRLNPDFSPADKEAKKAFDEIKNPTYKCVPVPAGV